MKKNNLKKIRNHLGWSQAKAAQEIGVTLRTIVNWEQGTTYPSVPEINKILKAYDISYNQAFVDETIEI